MNGNGNGVRRFEKRPGMAVETSMLVERLKEGVEGEQITDEELSGLVSRDVRPTGEDRQAYGYLLSAMKHVLNTYGVIWEREPGAGYIQCQDADGCMQLHHRDRRHVHRVLKRNTKRLTVVDTSGMDGKQRTEFNALLAQSSGLMQAARADATRKAIERKIGEPVDFWGMLASHGKDSGKCSGVKQLEGPKEGEA